MIRACEGLREVSMALRGYGIEDSWKEAEIILTQCLGLGRVALYRDDPLLSPLQMEALRKAKGEEFDYLFLKGMIQHHGGALTMVKDLFDTAGAGQDAELFNFATDVDSGQRAEIRIMQNMLERKSPKDK